MNDFYIRHIEKQLSKLTGEECILTLSNSKDKVLTLSDISYEKTKVHEFSIFLRSKKTSFIISTCQMIQMAGCCGICVSTGAYVHEKYRGKGINTLLNQLRIRLAKELGYSILLCTDVATNIPQKKTLLKNGWQDIFRFRNKRTNNLVDISVIHL